MDIYTKSFLTVARRFSHFRQYCKIVGDQMMDFNVGDPQKLLAELKMSHKEGYTCLITDCKICCKKSTGNLFINKTTGFYMCEKCQCKGEWKALKQLFSSAMNKKCRLSKNDLLELKSDCNEFASHDVDKVLAHPLKHATGLPKDDIMSLLQRLKLPLVEFEVLKQLGVFVDSDESSLYFPLKTTVNLVTGWKVISKNRLEDIVSASVEGSGLFVVHPKMFKKTPWRSSLTKSVTTAVVVLDIADALALVCAEVNQHIICLPNGVSSLPIDVLPLLEQYEKIILWFGNCDGAWDAVQNFSKKLDETRCHVVKPTTSAPNARFAFDEGLDIPKMINEAKPLFIEAVTSFERLREDVLAELQNIGKIEGVKWTRFPLLNHLLKGFRRGELTVLSGSTGCGKTTFMSQYSLDLAEQGVNTLWGSFEIPNQRLARIMLTQVAGTSLQQNMDKFNIFADKLEKLPIYFMKLHGEHSSDKVLKVVEHATYVYDIGHVIIDTVQFMMGISEDNNAMDRFWRQDNIIARFRSFATSCNCHVTLIIHPRKERPGESLHLNSVFGGAKATQEADNVFMLQDERESSGHIFFKVLKNRYSGNLGRMPLEFNKISLSFDQKKAVPQVLKKSEEESEGRHIDFYQQQKQRQWW